MDPAQVSEDPELGSGLATTIESVNNVHALVHAPVPANPLMGRFWAVGEGEGISGIDTGEDWGTSVLPENSPGGSLVPSGLEEVFAIPTPPSPIQPTTPNLDGEDTGDGRKFVGAEYKKDQGPRTGAEEKKSQGQFFTIAF